MSELARSGLAVIGGAVGGWPGYLVGTIVGGLLFPPASQQKPENLAGMRLAGPTLGTPLPIAMGQVLLRGHVIWQGPLIEQQRGKKGGGAAKKGGSQTSYRRSFMHALCEGHEDIRLLRIYQGDDLLWDANDPQPGQESGIDFTFYPGTGWDMPDPRMAAYQSGGVGVTTTMRTETVVLDGADPTYTVRKTPVVSGSDLIWPVAGGVFTPFRRVGSNPGQNEYTIDYASGFIAFGGTYGGLTVTIRYGVATATSLQVPLAYRHVCKVYVHEYPLVGKSLPQLTYEICAPVNLFGWRWT